MGTNTRVMKEPFVWMVHNVHPNIQTDWQERMKGSSKNLKAMNILDWPPLNVNRMRRVLNQIR